MTGVAGQGDGTLHRLAIESRYRLARIGYADCPARFRIAIPRDIGSALPPAARPGQGRAPAGRGLSEALALASCLGEAAELLSSCFWGGERLVSGSARRFGDQCVPLNRLTLFSPAQIGRLDSLAPFDPDAETSWIEARSLCDRDTCFVPAAYAFIGWQDERAEEPRLGLGDSNGCACAPTPTEAILAGFLELVERDATALWWYGCHQRPAIVAADLGVCPELLGWLAERRRRYHLLDITTDFALPIVAAVSCEPDGSTVAFGAAAHFEPRRAATSALTEMLQSELSLELARASPGPTELDGWMRTVNDQTAAHLCPGHMIASLQPAPVRPTPAEQLTHCLDACRRLGLKPLVLDLSRPWLGVPAVRVIVPGLRPSKPRFAPGRLYEAPARLGWSAAGLSESLLNPLPLTI